MEGTRNYEKTVCLLCFGELECAPEITENLRSCGFTVKTLYWNTDSVVEFVRRPPDILVCAFGSEPEFEKEQNFIGQLGIKSPVLGVLCNNLSNVGKEILNQCNEFLYWPCHKFELQQRIARMPQIKSVCEPSVVNDTLIAEFKKFGIYGRSFTFLETLRLAKKASSGDAHVLLKGDSGTGKEVFARAIHHLSPRQKGPFIAVNCGVISDALIERVLFGDESGSTTDARSCQSGVVEQANGGTLFIDEIDSLSMNAQVALLRFLQEFEYTPIGGKYKRSADVKLIAATHTDLQTLVDLGSFRQDLMYRLEVMTIPLPSLKQRIGDTELLAEEFLKRFKYQYNKPGKYFHYTAIQNMKSYTWPGNVRELENRIHREFLLSDENVLYMRLLVNKKEDRRISILDRRISNFFNGSYKDTKSQFVADFEKRYLCWLMSETNGNVTRAAQRVGKERRALGKLLKKYDIDKTSFQLTSYGTLQNSRN